VTRRHSWRRFKAQALRPRSWAPGLLALVLVAIVDRAVMLTVLFVCFVGLMLVAGALPLVDAWLEYRDRRAARLGKLPPN
jgi:hypothetical protein